MEWAGGDEPASVRVVLSKEGTPTLDHSVYGNNPVEALSNAIKFIHIMLEIQPELPNAAQEKKRR
jgi:hypothetical protein